MPSFSSVVCDVREAKGQVCDYPSYFGNRCLSCRKEFFKYRRAHTTHVHLFSKDRHNVSAVSCLNPGCVMRTKMRLAKARPPTYRLDLKLRVIPLPARFSTASGSKICSVCGKSRKNCLHIGGERQAGAYTWETSLTLCAPCFLALKSAKIEEVDRSTPMDLLWPDD